MASARCLPTTAAVALLLVVALAAGPGRAAASAHDDCDMAQQAFSECVTYVLGRDPAPTPNCCRGLAMVSEMGGTAAQRRALCACVLSEVKAAGRVDPARAAGLPAACKVQIGFLATKADFECSKVL